MRLFYDSKLCIMDLEFTSMISVNSIPEIVEIGALKIRQDLTIVEEFQKLVKPVDLDSYDEVNQELTGISYKELIDAPDWSDVWREFAVFTGFSNVRLSTWGTAVDIPILKHEYSKRNLGYPHHVMPIDAASVASTVLNCYGAFNVRSLALRNICKILKIKVRKEHRALEDCQTVLRVFRELMKLSSSENEEDEFNLMEF